MRPAVNDSLPGRSDFLAKPVILAIGGFDPTGGAGVVRDFLTARSLGADARLIPAAWTEQSPAGVVGIEPRERLALTAAIRWAWQDAAAAPRESVVVKIGMVPDGPAAAAIVEGLDGFAGAVVLDPVLRASSGGALYTGDVAALVELGRRATVVTPNASEAALLSGMPVRDAQDAAVAGAVLGSRGWAAVLVKGGHLEGGDAVDVLVRGGEARRFQARRWPGPSVRGTGCALATAIAVGLGRGLALEIAVSDAKRWLTGVLEHPVSVRGEWHLPG